MISKTRFIHLGTLLTIILLVSCSQDGTPTQSTKILDTQAFFDGMKAMGAAGWPDSRGVPQSSPTNPGAAGDLNQTLRELSQETGIAPAQLDELFKLGQAQSMDGTVSQEELQKAIEQSGEMMGSFLNALSDPEFQEQLGGSMW